MKTFYIMLLSACVCTLASAQSEQDSADIFYQHLELDEVVVSSPVGQIKRKQSATPVSVVAQKTLRQTSSSNIVDAIAQQPGIAQITTGSGISKPVIRGLGYNRIVTVADGIRQEGQQWGDEHGLELDGAGVGQVEVLKGPASLMYGSDAMAGVVIFHPEPIEADGTTSASLSSEYQTNSGLVDYSLRLGGNQKGIVWNGRYSEKFAHAYKNKYDGYVPGSQFHERAVGALVGMNKEWGFSHLTLGYYHLTPSMIEGERDEVTGELISTDDVKTYHKTAPFQQIRHYKAVLDNSLTLGGGLLKAIVGYQHNRRQEFEEPGEAELDFCLHTLTYDARYIYSGWNGWRLTGGVGGMWQRSANKGEEFLIPAYRLFDFGVYVTGSKQLNKWSLSGGVRFDNRNLHSFRLTEDGEERFSDFRRNFHALTASCGAVFHMTPRTNLRANIARGFRAPNLSELGSNGVHEGTLRYELGNNGLRAEQSWQADLGADFSGKYVSAEVSLFLNRIENYVFAERVSDLSSLGSALCGSEMRDYEDHVYRYTQGDALLKGFEATVDIHPLHQLHVGSTFSMVDARQLNQPRETRYLPLTPAHRLTGEVKWEFLHNGDHHAQSSHHLGEKPHHHRIDHLFDNAFVSLGVSHHFRQDHYYMADDTETATPAYTLLSATLGSDILLHGKRKLCEIYIIGDNLLNTAYQSHLSRLKYTDVNHATARRGIFNPGRNVTFKVIFPVSW